MNGEAQKSPIESPPVGINIEGFGELTVGTIMQCKHLLYKGGFDLGSFFCIVKRIKPLERKLEMSYYFYYTKVSLTYIGKKSLNFYGLKDYEKIYQIIFVKGDKSMLNKLNQNHMNQIRFTNQ